jgi:hypothetical protein
MYNPGIGKFKIKPANTLHNVVFTDKMIGGFPFQLGASE